MIRFRPFAVALLLAAGCSSSGNGLLPETSIGWPAANPRLRLSRVVATNRDLSGGPTLLERLSGRSPRPLFDRPVAVAWHGDRLFVADTGQGSVTVLSSFRRNDATPAGSFRSPVGLAVCRDGLYVADSIDGEVWRLDFDLRRRTRVGSGFQRPTAVACAPGGDLLVVETGAGRIAVVPPIGDQWTIGSRGSGEGQFNFPTAIAAAPDGYWVGDTLNFRVQFFDWDHRFVCEFGGNDDAPGSMPRLKGLATGEDGNLWVTDARTDRVSVYSSDGRLLLSFGGTGDEPGNFQHPAGIAMAPDGSVAVADSLNHRIQVIQPVADPSLPVR